MTVILTKRKNLFLVLDGDLMIYISDFCLNVPDLYFSGFGIRHCPNIESGEIAELSKKVL